MSEKRKLTSDSDIVYIFDEQCFGVVVSPGAYASLINYIKDGVEYHVEILNEEFTIVNKIGMGYIQEEDL